MTASPWIAALFALFVWWFSTGAILWVVKGTDARGPEGHSRSVVLGLPVLGAGTLGVAVSVGDATVSGVYLAFLSALAVWAWIELAFLSGIITGPNPYRCPAGAGIWERFVRAWGTIAYHEMLLLAALAAIAFLSDGAANRFALLTFSILFCARISAKLNLFFGVPKINADFLPVALGHLPSHFKQARLNPIFPLSVTGLTSVAFLWFERALAAQAPAEAVGFALLVTLTLLALFEHWMMVLPVPDDKLWRWMIPTPKTHNKTLLREDPNGL
ncbi:MAG: putative photosynthetic complex assembly protein PuhE [Pseudomonadota bacterium]